MKTVAPVASDGREFWRLCIRVLQSPRDYAVVVSAVAQVLHAQTELNLRFADGKKQSDRPPSEEFLREFTFNGELHLFKRRGAPNRGGMTNEELLAELEVCEAAEKTASDAMTVFLENRMNAAELTIVLCREAAVLNSVNRE